MHIYNCNYRINHFIIINIYYYISALFAFSYMEDYNPNTNLTMLENIDNSNDLMNIASFFLVF